MMIPRLMDLRTAAKAGLIEPTLNDWRKRELLRWLKVFAIMSSVVIGLVVVIALFQILLMILIGIWAFLYGYWGRGG